jgi:hypothetical protein
VEGETAADISKFADQQLIEPLNCHEHFGLYRIL